jgi:hypothetical protein
VTGDGKIMLILRLERKCPSRLEHPLMTARTLTISAGAPANPGFILNRSSDDKKPDLSHLQSFDFKALPLRQNIKERDRMRIDDGTRSNINSA